MDVVVNNIVKMEWSKKGWLQTSSRGGRKPVFILASQDYVNADGRTISVIFTASTAFLFVSDAGTDEEDIWTAQELIQTLKAEMQGNFPYSLEEYLPIIESGEYTCKVDVLEKYGLLDYKDDIEARLKDVAPYGYEEDFKLG